MRSFKKLLLAVALFASAALHAQVSTYTYSGLTWGFSSTTAGLTACTQLVLDATGDVFGSDNFTVYGQLYCPSLGGSYASSGNAYFDSIGGFHMTTTIGVTYQLVCDNLSGSTYSGSCPIYNNLGTQVGSAVISFL
ncbi:MAG: hypothetical protein JWQ07_1423 [Ramlibacter sp.]|nr:hypothetical protein [Ramlibacter sp.]